MSKFQGWTSHLILLKSFWSPHSWSFMSASPDNSINTVNSSIEARNNVYRLCDYFFLQSLPFQYINAVEIEETATFTEFTKYLCDFEYWVNTNVFHTIRKCTNLLIDTYFRDTAKVMKKSKTLLNTCISQYYEIYVFYYA